MRESFEAWWPKFWVTPHSVPVMNSALKEVAEHAWQGATTAERKRWAAKLTPTDGKLRLMAGEMTAQEMRTVRAVLNGIRNSG